jgi:FkbM family methyltransferase
MPLRFQRTMQKVVPQPQAYSPDEVRSVVRFGMQWQLHPAQYFQWHQYFGFADPVLETLSKLARPGDVVADVGANIGFYSGVLAQRVGSTGSVHAFEPNPATHAWLAAHVRDNRLSNVRCHALALADVEQELTLNEFGGSDSGKASLRPDGAGQVIAGPVVDVRSLDGWFAQSGERGIDLIKVDVEGYEPEMLLGAARTIREFLPIICLEWSPGWHRGREDKATAARKLLRELGYDCLEVSSAPAQHVSLSPLDLDALRETRNVLLVPPGAERRLSLLMGS